MSQVHAGSTLQTLQQSVWNSAGGTFHSAEGRVQAALIAQKERDHSQDTQGTVSDGVDCREYSEETIITDGGRLTRSNHGEELGECGEKYGYDSFQLDFLKGSKSE